MVSYKSLIIGQQQQQKTSSVTHIFTIIIFLFSWNFTQHVEMQLSAKWKKIVGRDSVHPQFSKNWGSSVQITSSGNFLSHLIVFFFFFFFFTEICLFTLELKSLLFIYSVRVKIFILPFQVIPSLNYFVGVLANYDYFALRYFVDCL